MRKNKQNISVCLPVYNGESFLLQQIESIQSQLIDGDELIISDDHSSDRSLEIIQNIFTKGIVIIKNDSNIGLINNLSNCLLSCRSHYIFIADQDDLWPVQRVDTMLEALQNSQKELYVGNASCINHLSEAITYRFNDILAENSQSKYLNLLKIITGKTAYNGCCMAMTSKFRDKVCPIPRFVESHDLWFAVKSILDDSIFHSTEDITLRRIHGNNLSFRHRYLYQKIYSRIIMLRMIFQSL